MDTTTYSTCLDAPGDLYMPDLCQIYWDTKDLEQERMMLEP